MDLQFFENLCKSNVTSPLQASAHVILPTIPWFHLNPHYNSQMMESSYYTAGYASPAKRKVLGDINNKADSPISPTANLKLLTKVASQYDSIENSEANIPRKYTIPGTPPKSKLVEFENENFLNRQIKGTRKFKSLGYLCDKFLKLYPLEVPENIHSQILLSDLACQLGVEKRRIYDIINVVESLQMATKVGKNSYTWTGHKKLSDTLSQLKVYAEQVGLMQYVRQEQLNRKLYISLQDGEIDSMKSSMFTKNSNVASFFRNERRIGILCQKFVMLFLVSLKDGLVNLDLAAEVLMGEHCQQNKTRLRRLYDIANILVSLGIIEKTDMGGAWKKPVFRYAGPSICELEKIVNENTILENLVKTEFCDSISSDLSEDSIEVPWEQPDVTHHPPSVAETDHSYSLDVTKGSNKPTAVVEPAAKKRLIFSNNLLDCQPVPVEVKSCSQVTPVSQKVSTSQPQSTLKRTVLRVLGQGSLPQPIANGGVYKAVRVGNDIQLIRIDNS